MNSDRIRFRFEQRRGHYLVAEGTDDRALTRGDCDAFQLRMLTACEVPGLLKLEVEELDGLMSLRYALSGTRMLSQVKRAQKWTMSSYMGALCRLAEVMEDCRLYVLNPDCLLLDDDHIFIGGAGEHDLRFVYLPIPAEPGACVKAMESLIVRWMLHLSNPDGKAIQQVLRLAASPDFKPADLSRFVRQYLAGDREEDLSPAEQPAAAVDRERGRDAASGHAGTMPKSSTAVRLPTSGPKPDNGYSFGDGAAAGDQGYNPAKPATAGWRWFQPASADAHGMSALLGDDSEPYGQAPDAPPSPSTDEGRRKVWLACAAVGVTAIAWRWGYAAAPGVDGLSVSVGVTLAVLAAVGWLWLSPKRANRNTGSKRLQMDDHMDERDIRGVRDRRKDVEDAIAAAHADSDYASSHHHLIDRSAAAPSMASVPERSEWLPMEQTGDQANWEGDRTQYLDHQPDQINPSTYYLDWETEMQASPVPLIGTSLVIGRSREAAGHVDVTPGISRAHLELLRTDEGWTATDLGSRNGSKLNGAAMVAYEPYPLHPEDSLELAGSVYRLKYGRLQHAGSTPHR